MPSMQIAVTRIVHNFCSDWINCRSASSLLYNRYIENKAEWPLHFSVIDSWGVASSAVTGLIAEALLLLFFVAAGVVSLIFISMIPTQI